MSIQNLLQRKMGEQYYGDLTGVNTELAAAEEQANAALQALQRTQQQLAEADALCMELYEAQLADAKEEGDVIA